MPADTPDPAPVRSLMEEVQEDLDREAAKMSAPAPAAPPGPPPSFKRRLVASPPPVAPDPRNAPASTPVTAGPPSGGPVQPGSHSAEAISEPPSGSRSPVSPAAAPASPAEPPRPLDGAPKTPEARAQEAPRYTETPEPERTIPYREWVRQKAEKYDRLLRSRTSPDFLDIDALNTVMADFGPTFIEVSREARLWADVAQDAKDVFETWWAGKVTEARTLAQGRSLKITSDSGLNSFAESEFAVERAQRLSTLRDVERRAEFMGTLKMVVQNTATVLKAAAPSFAFVWGTSGGLTVKTDGMEYRGVPARRIEEKPPPDALLRARRARFEGTQT